MNSLLVIHSSARTERSITRQLAERFTARSRQHHDALEVVVRDIGIHPPRAIDDQWIAAAFSRDPVPSDEGRAALAASETLVSELFAADAVVIGAPMYNFGVPAALKAYFDQIVRVGRTFDFVPESESPYVPLIPAKPVIVITSKGAGGYAPGGPYAAMNFLEPHIAAVLGFVGLTDQRFVSVEFEEFKDERCKQAIAEAEAAIDRLADELAAAKGADRDHPALTNA